jgi:hypothetical protein
MTGLFGNFDFAMLNDPEFGEDSVREEMIVPLLAALGYSASPPYRIIRSRKVEHPFVYFGTVRKGISIIPDYLLERDGEFVWILDAKGPRENIDTGKNVEQAYSYAMHRDIRVPLYGLCNGHKLVVYHVSHASPMIDIQLQEIETIWPTVLKILGCKPAWPNGVRPDFRADMGLALVKSGLTHAPDGKKFFHIFMSLVLTMVARIEDGVYAVNAICDPTEGALLITIDFGQEKYEGFLGALPGDLRESVKTALTRQPYRVFFERPDAPFMTIAAQIGDTVFTNEDESYCPFEAESFISEYVPDDKPRTGDLASEDE